MKLLIIPLAIVLLVSCSGFQVSDDATYKVLAYATGKATAITINKIKPEVDPELTSVWVGMMTQNEGEEMVEPAPMIAFYNHCLVIIVGGEFDKYGLIGDLSALMTVFAAEMDPETNQMTFIKPVPYYILQYFEMGYANGRQVARKDDA